MSTRLDLQQIIDSNIYDNNNKEILASMMRTVLEALMNSDFNKDDDQLQNLKYNATKTLAQQFALLPIIQEAVIGPLDVGGTGTNSETVSGVAISCLNVKNSYRSDLRIIFPPELDIINKKVLFSFYFLNPTGERPNDNADLGMPAYSFVSPTEMLVALREYRGVAQDMYLKIYFI